MINDAGRLLYKIFTSHFIARVQKGCVVLNRSPGVHSGGCWLSLLHLVSLRLQLYSPVHWLIELNCPASVQFISLILPSNSHAEIWTRLHASAISSDIWRSGCVTSAIYGMACVIVIERK